MINQISLVAIPVRDQDKSLKFYTQKLGFKIVTDQPFGEGLRWIELNVPGSKTNLALFTPPGQENRVGTFSNISFSCRDIDETYVELKEKGVEFDAPPKRESWGAAAIFKDIDGNSFCLVAK